MSLRSLAGLPSRIGVDRAWWIVLVAAQTLICTVVFWRFLGGQQAFAYLDIGSDSYKAYVPYMMLWSDYLRDVGLAGWSFRIGLGGQVVPFLDPISWIPALSGAEHVIDLRVWVMIARLLVAGWAMYAVLRRLSVQSAGAAIGALMYSFCGYAQIDAQWDHMANELVFYPIVLFGILHRLQGGRPVVLAAVVAAAVVSNVFFVSLSVFTFLVFLGNLSCADRPRDVLVTWLTRILPPFLLGMGLAAPVLLPYMHQLLDSPRVLGEQALFSERLAEFFSVNDLPIVLVQLSGLFNKNLLGIGSQYAGWGNYLEGPGFYIGTLGLLLIPQLWLAGGAFRRGLLVVAVGLSLYFLFPAFRYAAYGFAIQYFRVSTLWITMLLVLLAAWSLDHVLRHGINRKLLLAAAIFSWSVPTLLRMYLPVVPSAHYSWLAFSGLATILLFASTFRRPGARWLAVSLLALVASEAAWTAFQSVNVGRFVVDARMAGYKDVSSRIIDRLRELDGGFYRIEKSFVSVADNDALAQRYYGVQSYAFHGSSVVRLHTALGTIPANGRGVNYTNWLPDFGGRFTLYSWVGVKYFLTRSPIAWPGFEEIGRAADVIVYRNGLALPLGLMYYQQVSERALDQLPLFERDRFLLDAVVTEQSLPDLPPAAVSAMRGDGHMDMDLAVAAYVEKARAMQAAGLRLSGFEQNRVVGRVEVPRSGVLVFSIPYNAGWSARVDGQAASVFRANYGFTAIALAPGSHQVELVFNTPWLFGGLWLAVVACALLGFLEYRSARVRRARIDD